MWLQLELWRDATDWKHPMEHYTYRSREPFTGDRGKCMIDPNHMGGFNVSHHTPHAPLFAPHHKAKEQYLNTKGTVILSCKIGGHLACACTVVSRAAIVFPD